MKFNVFVTVQETSFEVVGCFERYVPPSTSGHPDNWEPSEPEEFDAPQEPVGYKEVTLPNGDIEMVPIYKKDDE